MSTAIDRLVIPVTYCFTVNDKSTNQLSHERNQHIYPHIAKTQHIDVEELSYTK